MKHSRQNELMYLCGGLLLGAALTGGILIAFGFRRHSTIDLGDTSTYTSKTSPTEPSDAHIDISQTVPPKTTERQISPAASSLEWNLLLVNPWSTLPENFQVDLTELINNHYIDERAYPDLQEMMDDARAEGLSPLICSSYRTMQDQQELYDNKVASLLDEGWPQEDAKTEAARWVAIPGTSEHQTGLAVDIVATNYQMLDEQQEETPEQQWLMENSWKYGFILRYPSNKSNITGIYYEPWHYRYVGREAAQEIYEQGICLEEYLENLSK